MVKFYINKIRNKEINSNTGQAWKIEDVPTLWKKRVKKEMNAM